MAFDFADLFMCGGPRKRRNMNPFSQPAEVQMPCGLPVIQGDNVKTVAGFLEGAAVFAISRMWADMISAFLLHLSSVPYCGGFIKEACTGTAASGAMFVYALCTLPVAGLLK